MRGLDVSEIAEAAGNHRAQLHMLTDDLSNANARSNRDISLDCNVVPQRSVNLTHPPRTGASYLLSRCDPCDALPQATITSERFECVGDAICPLCISQVLHYEDQSCAVRQCAGAECNVFQAGSRTLHLCSFTTSLGLIDDFRQPSVARNACA